MTDRILANSDGRKLEVAYCVRLMVWLSLVWFLAACGGGGGGGGGGSPPPNPVPSITSMSPTSAIAGDPAFTLTVDGSSFVSGSKVQWSGSVRTTTFVSSTRLTASIPASDIASIGIAAVTVFSPAPGGGTSANDLRFDIFPNSPTMISLSPSATPAGSPPFTMTVYGTGFGGSTVLLWNGSPRVTRVNDPTRLDAQILASDVATTGSAQVTVETPPPGGGASGPLTFQITAAALGRNDTRATATPISNGTIAASISPYGDEDFYSFQATAGATVTVEILARGFQSSLPSRLDSVIEIQNSTGTRPTTGCRSPDHPLVFINGIPTVNDLTPNAFDDECVDDDIILGSNLDSLLEFQPSATGTYYVHVVDVRGDGRPDMIYELSLSGAD